MCIENSAVNQISMRTLIIEYLIIGVGVSVSLYLSRYSFYCSNNIQQENKKEMFYYGIGVPCDATMLFSA